MGAFGAFFGCIGVVGFNGCCSGARSGDGGFIAATSQLPVHEKVRPARPDVRASAKRFALLAHNTPNSAFLRLPGEVFRGNVAGGPLLGEYFHGPAVVGLVAGPFYWQC